MTWLPGGEGTLALDPERAEGRLVVERLFLDGQVIGPFTLTYSGGRMQAMESDADLSILRQFIDPDLPLSDRLTGLKFGVNPHVTDARLLPRMGTGVVSLSMGSTCSSAATSRCRSTSSSPCLARRSTWTTASWCRTAS
jgi:hypothetical protein